MPADPGRFQESSLGATPIRDLELTIAGTPLEPVLAEFEQELTRAGLVRVRPRVYLSTEWGVPFGTVSLAIPFYLAHPDPTAIHTERNGYVEGLDRSDILRYLRHEMGHVVNYAYRLYNTPEWVELFGSITRPYIEEYRPEPFSRRYVRHLPDWYAQKHPDEDWAETFAVWLTPGLDWKADYGAWPEAHAKLAYCDRIMAEVRRRSPVVTATEPDEDVSEIAYALDQYYDAPAPGGSELPPGLDGALRTIFEDLDLIIGDAGRSPNGNAGSGETELAPAAALLRRIEPELQANIFRWTGHSPARTRDLVRALADRAARLDKGYDRERETEVVVAIATLVTGLAMNYVQRGSYLP